MAPTSPVKNRQTWRCSAGPLSVSGAGRSVRTNLSRWFTSTINETKRQIRPKHWNVRHNSTLLVIHLIAAYIFKLSHQEPGNCRRSLRMSPVLSTCRGIRPRSGGHADVAQRKRYEKCNELQRERSGCLSWLTFPSTTKRIDRCGRMTRGDLRDGGFFSRGRCDTRRKWRLGVRSRREVPQWLFPECNNHCGHILSVKSCVGSDFLIFPIHRTSASAYFLCLQNCTVSSGNLGDIFV
jgi:hypothetical protein